MVWAGGKGGVVNMHRKRAAEQGESMGQQMEAAEENKTFGQRLVSWLGRLHSLVVHFPIAMFLGALGVELFGLWKGRRDYEWVARVMLVIGAIGAVAAAFLGWFAGGFSLRSEERRVGQECVSSFCACWPPVYSKTITSYLS